jgi:hypothetical protein
MHATSARDRTCAKASENPALPTVTNTHVISQHARCGDVATQCDHFASMSRDGRCASRARRAMSIGSLGERRESCFHSSLRTRAPLSAVPAKRSLVTRCWAKKLDSPQHLVLASVHLDGTREGDLVTARSDAVLRSLPRSPAPPLSTPIRSHRQLAHGARPWML